MYGYSDCREWMFNQRDINLLSSTDENCRFIEDLFNVKTAIKWLKLAAGQGHIEAQYLLAVMYDKEDSDAEAVKWFRLAAEQGSYKAQSKLGLMYFWGDGVPKDYKEAVKWYRLSAEQGNAIGQYRLGNMFAKGKGVTRDYNKAIMWWQRAAEQGNMRASYSLGNLYSGMSFFENRPLEGAPRNYKKAFQWYGYDAGTKICEGCGCLKEHGPGICMMVSKAIEFNMYDLAKIYVPEALSYLKKRAEGVDPSPSSLALSINEWGDPVAQYILGELYRKGSVLPQDYVKAHMYYSISINSPASHYYTIDYKGGYEPYEKRDIVEKDMSPEQITEAQRLAKQWMTSRNPNKSPKWSGEFR